jgi:hypothetical protein
MCAKLRVIRPGEPDEPIDKYLSEVNSGSTDPFPYERLMIHFRREKKYAEELKIISKGITVLEKIYKRQQSQTLGGRVSSSIKKLSEKISMSTGLRDKKGNTLYLPEPLPKWLKRKAVTEAKLKAQAAKAAGKKIPTKKKAVRKRKP